MNEWTNELISEIISERMTERVDKRKGNYLALPVKISFHFTLQIAEKVEKLIA